MIGINTNLGSLIVQSNLKKSTNALNTAIERMTTGFKINHAKDNAANYSISTNMSSKISAYEVAEDNALIGLDILNTASSSIELISSGLSRLRALAEQAANGTYGSESLDAINKEANSIVDEINRLYTTTEFNGVQLLKQDRLPSANFIKEVKTVDTSGMTKLSEVDLNTSISSGSYSISTAEELAKLSEMTNTGKIQGGNFYLADNIDLSGYQTGEGWTPIGTSANPFKGTFNGNGYVISNLYINTTASTTNVGLFGVCNTLNNVGVENAYVYAPNADYVGILTGSNRFHANTVTNCYSSGNVVGRNYVGGLGGRLIVSDCYSKANVTGDNSIGGIVGNGTVSNSFSTSNVSGNSNIGGIIGTGDWIKNCYTTSKVSGNKNVGGVAGGLSWLEGCYVLSRCESLDGIFSGNNAKISDSYYSSYYTGKPMAGGTGQNVTNVQVYDGDVPFEPIPEYHPVRFDLQVGIDSSSGSSITVDTSFDIWNLEKLRNIGYVDSSVMLKTVDELLSRVNERQTSLGAYQNRLNSVLEEISIKYDNLLSSRSTIRDADIAEVSSEYIRQQILQQAAATLLATANQTPAIALQLL